MGKPPVSFSGSETSHRIMLSCLWRVGGAGFSNPLLPSFSQVRLFRLSVADTAGLIREFGVEAVLVDSLSKLEWTHEQIRKAMFKHRKLIRGQVQIIDVGDYGEVPDWTGRMWNNLRLGPDIYKVFDGNYPETVRKVFIVRTSSLVHHGYMLIQRLLPQRTKRKLKLYGPKASRSVFGIVPS